jgi:hypothetical protein
MISLVDLSKSGRPARGRLNDPPRRVVHGDLLTSKVVAVQGREGAVRIRRIPGFTHPTTSIGTELRAKSALGSRLMGRAIGDVASCRRDIPVRIGQMRSDNECRASG